MCLPKKIMFWKIIAVGFILCIPRNMEAQILFSEECFIGGVTTAGLDNIGSGFANRVQIKWEADYTLRRAYAITYRYGRPAEHNMIVNGVEVIWNLQNQAGPEQIEINSFSQFFAPHVQNISDHLQVTNDTLIVDFPPQEFYDFAWNWGWWGIYVLIFYESPSITTEVCNRIYIANQSQVTPQNYTFQKPEFISDTPINFAIHSSRLSPFYSDATKIRLNNTEIGEIWGPDLVSPPAYAGVQGHFFYHNSIVEGLNGDTANFTVHGQDGIAIINQYLNSGSPNQNIQFVRSTFDMDGGFNPHPSFNLTYTPSCTVPPGEMPRTITYCRGESAELNAIPDYENYAWSSTEGLSDSTINNPFCTADTSRWYTVRMWNDDGNVCPQTIPVFVEVGDIPRPSPLSVSKTGCPNNSGRINFENTPGKAPLVYSVGDISQPGPTFNNLAPGTYPVSVTDALGCTWDSIATVGLNTSQTAAFTPNPTSGENPLTVYFNNQSTNATGYEWLVDDEPFSTSFNAFYVFPDSGSFMVSLVAWVSNPSCADTATYLIRVDPGIQVAMPNIITPNGDGLNDRLVTQLFGVSRISWQVFNRWGQQVHTGSDNSGASTLELWDGRTRGNEVAEGVYQLTCTVQGLTGKIEKMQFQVTVVR